MTTQYSLTRVSKELVAAAVENYRNQWDADFEEYGRRLGEWRDSYKFTWWQKNVKKLDKLNAEDLLREIHGHSYAYHNRKSFPLEEYLVKLGLWDWDFHWTLGVHGSTWKDVAIDLYLCPSDEGHLVSEGALRWITNWANKQEERE